MTKPRVFSKRENYPPDCVDISRTSKWGNRFVVGKDGNRLEVCIKHAQYLLANPALMDALDALTGRDLVCWCAPEDCHGDVLLLAANVPREDRRTVIEFYIKVKSITPDAGEFI